MPNEGSVRDVRRGPGRGISPMRVGLPEKYSFSVDLREALTRNGPTAHHGKAESPRGIGFHVPVQKGLRSVTPPSGARPGSDAAGPRSQVAASYVGAPGDSLDATIEAYLRQLPQAAGWSLHVRRLGPGDYEFDGHRVSISMRVGEHGYREPLVASQEGDSEPLPKFVQRTCEGILGRQGVGAQGAAAPLPPPQSVQLLQGPPAQGNLNNPSSNSFCHSQADAGSFYAMRSPQPKGVDSRLEAMRMVEHTRSLKCFSPEATQRSMSRNMAVAGQTDMLLRSSPAMPYQDTVLMPPRHNSALYLRA